jgi:protein-tyrosine phosphatase
MMKHLKHIPLDGAYNVRDLGGYPTAQGFSTKWGMLYRGDALCGLTKKDWQVLLERNVYAVIDLRSKSEVKLNPIATPTNVMYEHFSLMKELDDLPVSNPNVMLDASTDSIDNFIESMKLDYSKTLFDNLTCCVDILNAITDNLGNGSVIFACTAGKDRTGIIAAAILYLCGVEREDIVADYIVSSIYNTNGVNKSMSTAFENIVNLFPDPSFLNECMASKPETIISLLDDMDDKNFKSLLSENGFGLEKQQELIAILVE